MKNGGTLVYFESRGNRLSAKTGLNLTWGDFAFIRCSGGHEWKASVRNLCGYYHNTNAVRINGLNSTNSVICSVVTQE